MDIDESRIIEKLAARISDPAGRTFDEVLAYLDTRIGDYVEIDIGGLGVVNFIVRGVLGERSEYEDTTYEGDSWMY